jgi:N-acetylmuramoyl-L-alanine amidase
MRPVGSKAKLFALGLAWWAIPCAAFAVSEPPGTPAGVLASLLPIGDDELASARGGFSVGGVDFNFGASVQTLVNGQLALQTNLQWTAAGAVVTQLQGLGTKIQTQVASTLANAGINVPTTSSPVQATVTTSPTTSAASASPATVATTPVVSNTQSTLNGASALTGGAITSSPQVSATPATNSVVTVPTTVSGSPASTTTIPVGVSISPSTSSTASNISSQASNITPNNSITPSNSPASQSGSSPTVLSGVQIQSATGSTEVLANVANGQIQSVVLNTASNQNIAQNTNILLTIYNFSSWQQMLAQHAMSAQLANQVLAASGFTGGR